MWKFGKDDEKSTVPTKPSSSAPSTPVAISHPTPISPKEAYPVETPRLPQNNRLDVAHIGKSVVIKGELSGSEDLYVDGEVEGSIELSGHSLTVGPNGRIRANIHAKEIVVHGRVDGDLHGSDRVELKRSGHQVGDIFTQRVVIEDGAYFKGGIDIQRGESKSAGNVENKTAGASSSGRDASILSQGVRVETK